jgi:HPt (histidine-containing phosphotransfer) domain-containing protein
MTDVIDPAAIDRLRDFGGDKLLRGMIELFVKNAPKRVTDARAALDAADAPSLKAALHGLKSSAGQLGATSVHQACAAGEELAALGDVASCAPHVQSIERDLPRACDALLTLRPASA